MPRTLNSITLDSPATPQSLNVDDTFSFAGTPGFSGTGGVTRYDIQWQVDAGGGYVTIGASGTGLITAGTNPVTNSNSTNQHSLTVACEQAGSYTIRMAGAPATGGSYTVFSSTQTVEVSAPAVPFSADLTAASIGMDGQSVTRLNAYAAAMTAPSFAASALQMTWDVAAGYVAELTAASYALTAQAVSRFNDWVGTLSAASVSLTAQAMTRVNAWGASLTAPIISLTARAFSWTVSGGEPTLPATAVLIYGKAFLPNGRQCMTNSAVSNRVNIPDAVHPVGLAYMTDLNTDPVPADAVFVSGYAYTQEGIAYVTTEVRDAGDAFVSGIAVRQDGAVRVTTDDEEEGDAVVSGQRMKQDGTKRIYLP